jgi:hypothetical protein
MATNRERYWFDQIVSAEKTGKEYILSKVLAQMK